MANHQLQFFTLNDQHTSNNNPMNQITQSTTNLRPIPNPNQNQNPNQNPNPTRGRRSGGRPQRVRDRPAQRGPSIAELERQIERQPTTIPPSNIRPVSDSRVNPLPGVPVIGYYQPVSDPRWITNRVGIPQSELPSMPNSPLQQPPFKIRLSDEEVGFAEGSNSHFSGIHMNNIGNNHNNPFPNVGGGSEVLAIHERRSNGSNMMMEYGFFPRKSEEIMELKNHEKYNPGVIEEQEQEREHYLKLKMGFTDSSSPSSSSSLSSLTTNNNSNNDSSIDLSLKL
ncbi:unnamed protein product [Amaranthus hypochondriacus]